MTQKNKKLLFCICGAILFLGIMGFYYFFYAKQIIAEKEFANSTADSYQQDRSLAEIYQPIRRWNVKEIDLVAKAAGAIELEQGVPLKILFTKNMQQSLPVASLSKLVGAMVCLDNYNLKETVIISQEAIAQSGDVGLLKAGEQLMVKNLLELSLIESSNDAIYALSEIMGTNNFVRLMNKKTQDIGLAKTYFVNPTGLYEANGRTNYSSGMELIKVIERLLFDSSYEPIVDIISTEESSFYSNNGGIYHSLKNTNELFPEFSFMIGGKTGYLPQTGGSLITIFQQPGKETYLISIILNSPDRFQETRMLLEWLPQGYIYLFNYGD